MDSPLTIDADDAPLRVLIADDDPSVRLLLRLTLQAEGFRTVEAADGVSALALLRAGYVDICLLDLRMPYLTGEQVLAVAGEALDEVPVIVLTGLDRSRGTMGLRLGAHDYVAKPFEPLELAARLHAAARVRRALRAGSARRLSLACDLNALEKAALTDELTGLGNRRLLRTALEEVAARCARESAPFSVAILDVDHLKCINDERGHDVGDAVLQKVALEISRALRADDIPIRWGGDEFVAVLPNTDSEAAQLVVERIRKALAASNFPTPVSVTVGIASGRAAADDLLRDADRALLEGKRAGRNCVHIAPSLDVTTTLALPHQGGQPAVS
jgi:two-component system, cell cycle response regulator